ncbi:MAG: prepilin-type N-terminal cleavage/methylation domain-containing protein [Candidatus Omnitrophota bacterium]|nr:MAG: prepilin-type N-terminal cleavage/methylation domain-containing protein [Candidatus Omnitrophota bacterium]
MRSRSVCRKRGFTLIEILISTSLLVIVGLAIYSTFNSGIKIWQKVRKSYEGEDVNILFEKFTTDLKNSFHYKGVKFIGSKHNVIFPTLVTAPSAASGLRKGVGQVSYRFDEDGGSIIQEKRNLSAIYKEKEGIIREILRDVKLLEFTYYMHDPLSDEYFWVEEWTEEETFPLAVSMKLEIIYDAKTYQFTKKVNIPVRRAQEQ